MVMVSTCAPPRPSSPAGSVSTSRSGTGTNSPRAVVTNRKKSFRRSSTKASAGITRVASNSSMSRTNTGNLSNVLAPPSLDVPFEQSDNASIGISAAPLPTPANNSDALPLDEPLHDGPSPIHLKYAIQPDPQNLNHRRSLPHPLPPCKCPLLCVFYSEFDIVVGPKVCFQSPHKFMHFDIDVSFEDIHNALDETFHSVMREGETQMEVVENRGNNKKVNHSSTGKEYIAQQDSDEYWDWSTDTKKSKLIEHEVSDISSLRTTPSSGHKYDKQNANEPHPNKVGSASDIEGGGEDKSMETNDSVSAQTKSSHKLEGTTNNVINTTAQSTHSRNPSFASSSKGTTSNQPMHEGDTSTIDTELLQNSIFGATSEYIITGNELANQTITVSTHGMHILSRPMIICDTQKYERNSFLFAVGFVLRRNVDPRPYWPILSKLSSTLRYMEVESEYLSQCRTRPQIQIILEDILVSLNSKQRDCHLLLDDANLLNLHLFRPPPPPTPPVPDHAVPILLRPADLLQLMDWDLTINWIVPHIDGCKCVKQIAISSEVDMEMVRACLRVLRHHGVLAHVDVFRYSNIYEFLPLAMQLSMGTSGKKHDGMSKLLDAAFWYSAKARYVCQAQMIYRDRSMSNGRNSPISKSNSPSNNIARRLGHSNMSSLHSLDLSLHSSTIPLASTHSCRQKVTEETSSPQSFPSRKGNMTIREDHSMDEELFPNHTSKRGTGSNQQCGNNPSNLEEIDVLKAALAQLYSSCLRDKSFGEMFLAKIENKQNQRTLVESAHDQTSARNFVDSKLTPLKEACETECYATRGTHEDCSDRKEAAYDIDWKIVFDFFDHRRLITFGVIHGLIRRVHQYPLACAIYPERDDTNISSTGRESVSSNGANNEDADDFSNIESSPEHYHVPIEMTAVEEAAAAAIAGKTAIDEKSRSTSYSSSPLLQSIPPPSLNGRDELLLKKLNQKELRQRSKKLMIERIALAMDGTRCDDELSCMFEVPIETLIEMLEASGRWNVISVFSCND